MKKYIVLVILLITGAILMQSFQCASRNMTTAKVKLKNKEMDEAEKFLKMELQQNPANEEAKLLLSEVYMMTDQNEKLINMMNELDGNFTNPEFNARYQAMVSKLWINAYNKGIQYYNKYLQSNENQYLDSAINQFDIGLAVRPQMVDFNSFKGMLLEMRGDTVEGMQEYQLYIDKMKPEIELAKNKGLFVGMKIDQVTKALGEPASSNGMKNQAGDSMLVQKFTNDGEVMAYYSGKGDKPLKLDGWRYNLPDSWSEREKLNLFKLDMAPMINLSQYYYNNGEKEKSLKYIKTVADIDPDNDEVNSFMISLYQELNKTDEAIKSLQDLVNKNPKNKVFWTKFGDLYINLGLSDKDMSDEQKMDYFQKAVEQYEKALEIDPNYSSAIRNMGSAYINIASVIQNQEIEKAEEDDTYEPDTEKYEPHLKNAAKFLSQALQTPDWKDDINTLNDIANVYMVLGQENDLKQIVRKMEALEYSITETSKKEQYYYNLLKLYSEMKESEKMKAVQKKIEDLSK